MKRLFTIFFALLLGITAAFAQTQPTLPYQAVVRDNQNHLLKDADVSIDVQIYEGATLRYSETQTPHSNANGLISFNIGAGSGATGTMADVADWRVAKFKFTYHLTDGDVVVTDSVHAVPYALQTAFATGGNFLTSDSAVITTMQGNITTNTTNIATNTDNIAALANRVNTFNTNVCDSVKNCDFSGNASIQGVLQELSDLISAQNHKIDSLGHIVDSLSSLPLGNTPAATFTCGTDSVKDADNNWYHTVKIGEQCWMKENLRTKSYANGTGIELSSNTSKETAYRYYPNGQESYVSTYGYLYNWKAVMDTSSSSDANPSGVQGVCPEGWHVPSKAEFQTLMNYCSDHYAAGGDGGNNAKALADTTNWSSSSYSNAIGNNLSANNQSGFSALPAGNYGGSYYGFRSYAYFWSSTPDGEYNAYYMTLNNDRSDARLESFSRLNGRSVRCLRDAGVGGTPGSNETAGTTPSAPATMSCEQVMECMGDTLGKLNEKIENLQNTVDSLSNLSHGGNTPAATFTCGTDSIKDFDNNWYHTVKIGEQCWMKENMKTTKFANGTEIALGGVSSTTPYLYYPNGDASNVATFGYLYNWTAAMNGASSTNEVPSGVQGICPDGWHIPSNAEWYQLTDFLGSNEDYVCDDNPVFIAKSVAATTEWNTCSSGCLVGSHLPTNNATGFTALPAGHYESNNGIYTYFRQNTGFWSSSLKDTDVAYKTYLYYYSCNVEHYESNIQDGCSVRCLRNPEAGGGTTPSAPGGDNACCSELGARLDSLEHVISSQDSTINALNEQVEDLLPFECGKSKLKDAEGNEYNTVLIGEQCWMKENLRTKTHTYGQVWTNTDVDSAIYGRYYDWQAAMQIDVANDQSYTAGDKHQGICPAGWHVPSDAEWYTLTDYVKLQPEYVCEGCSGTDGTWYTYCIAKALSQPTGWSNTGTGCNAGNTGDIANATGFSAVPAGECSSGRIGQFGDYAYFWSASQNTTATEARLRRLYNNVTHVYRVNSNKVYGHSVRCLKD